MASFHVMQNLELRDGVVVALLPSTSSSCRPAGLLRWLLRRSCWWLLLLPRPLLLLSVKVSASCTCCFFCCRKTRIPKYRL